MVTVAYLMWRNGWSRDEALAFVRSRRGQVRPNPAFMVLLREWEEVLQDRRGITEQRASTALRRSLSWLRPP
jgi:protein-tyrosine phosphatase